MGWGWGAGRPGPRDGGASAVSGGGVRGGKELLPGGLGALEKSPKGGRLNLTPENKVISLGRKECGRKVSLENRSL